MPNGTQRINLAPEVLRDSRVSKVDGTHFMWGSFPGGALSKEIKLDEKDLPYIDGSPHQHTPDFLQRYLRRETSDTVAA